MLAQGYAQHLGLGLQFKWPGMPTLHMAEDESVRNARGHLEYTFGGSSQPAPALEVGSMMKGSSDDLEIVMDGAVHPHSSWFTVKAFGQGEGNVDRGTRVRVAWRPGSWQRPRKPRCLWPGLRQGQGVGTLSPEAQAPDHG